MIKRFLCMAGLVMLALPCARGFSLGGPVGNGGDKWQVQDIGYGPPSITIQMAPKNLGEGYRRNIPTVYYAFSPDFLDYFGTVGETNIDEAFGLLNNALTNGVSSYSPGLSEVPLDSEQYNYTAGAYQIYDIKSMALAIMMIQLGLAVPEENTWRLHDRILPTGGKCPFDELYTVIQRNYDIIPSSFDEIQYSSYVNNVLYTYRIEEVCSGSPVLADTFIIPEDPLANSFTSVAGGMEGAESSGGLQGGFSLLPGNYYIGLTRDDVAGLRYLYGTNNIFTETVAGGSLLLDQSTNFNQEVQFPANSGTPQGFGTYSLSSLYSFSTTNSAAAIMTNFPGVVVASQTSYLVLASNATYSIVLAPAPNGSAYGSTPTFSIATNYTPYLATNYVTTFANVVVVNSNRYTTNLLISVTSAPKNGSAFGSPSYLSTNYQSVIITNTPSGDFYTVPSFGTNLCGSGIQSLGLSVTVYTTNLVTSAITNLVVSNTITGYSNVQYVVSSYVDHDYIAYAVNCAQTAGATGLYEGVDKLQFVRVNYDSLLGQTFTPITNYFSKVAITNGQTRVEQFSRLVSAPDVLIDASDLATGAADHPIFGSFIYARTSPNWDDANILAGAAGANGLAGPGTIDPIVGAPSIALVFNKVGPIYENGSLSQNGLSTNQFLAETNQYQLVAYGSFDGSTNAPSVYPSGSSIQNLQNQLLLQITPTSPLPNGTNGIPYASFQFTVTGGVGSFTPPYTFTTSGPPIVGSPTTSGLPPGLTLSSNGTLSGTPTQSGTYDFTLTMTDANSNTVLWNYTITTQ